VNRRGTFIIGVCILALTGLSIAVARKMQTGLPWIPGEQRSLWQVEARIDFIATGGPVTVSLSLPESLSHFAVMREQAASPGYGFAIVDDGGDRRAEWTRREAIGEQSLYYSAQFVPLPAPREVSEDEKPAARQVFWSEAEVTAARELIARATATSSDQTSLARELLKLLNASPQAADQNAALLLARADSEAELLDDLLNDAGIPAREVMALNLEDARRRQTLTPLIEMYDGEGWQLLDPETGMIDLPENMLLWHREGRSLLDVTGGRQSRVSFAMIEQSISATRLANAPETDSVFSNIGVHRLPIEEQSMFKLLLLLPIGAAVVVVMRILVGIKTSGTFMPVLIALAFLQTSLLPGLLSFVSVVAVGLVMRSYLSRLNLLLVSRIATLIVLVIFVISALSLLGYQLGYSTGMIITFFPMIIIAWTIERLSIIWEEDGPQEVFKQGGGSLLVAVIAYWLMQLRISQHLTFNFPELNLVLLAAIMAMGQYTGYKLSELRRFRSVEEHLK
jgi:hypothetical protein